MARQLRSGAAVQASARPANYYSASRPEIVELVPLECRRILDVGCARGELGRVLQQRGHQVTGIELVPAAAAEARRHLHQVHALDIESEGFPFLAASFDCLIFADVLEHFIDPWRVLREATELLAVGGCVVISVPNLQNWRILRGLLRGKWKYRERGILDRGHLRFFTRQTVEQLVADSGLVIDQIHYHFRASRFRSLLGAFSFGGVHPFLGRQILVVAHKPAAEYAA